tara:strand:+ start:833 stop:1066 length:234 start_codon:yes stop_codon:yes gene_type:complete
VENERPVHLTPLLWSRFGCTGKILIMDKEIEKFLIKLVTIVVSIIVIYFLTSPYQNCEREGNYQFGTVDYCLENTNW